LILWRARWDLKISAIRGTSLLAAAAASFNVAQCGSPRFAVQRPREIRRCVRRYSEFVSARYLVITRCIGLGIFDTLRLSIIEYDISASVGRHHPGTWRRARHGPQIGAAKGGAAPTESQLTVMFGSNKRIPSSNVHMLDVLRQLASKQKPRASTGSCWLRRFASIREAHIKKPVSLADIQWLSTSLTHRRLDIIPRLPSPSPCCDSRHLLGHDQVFRLGIARWTERLRTPDDSDVRPT
jgi:hypothetical protein